MTTQFKLSHKITHRRVSGLGACMVASPAIHHIDKSVRLVPATQYLTFYKYCGIILQSTLESKELLATKEIGHVSKNQFERDGAKGFQVRFPRWSGGHLHRLFHLDVRHRTFSQHQVGRLMEFGRVPTYLGNRLSYPMVDQEARG